MKLAVFDFDSTLMDGETIDFLADELGIGEEVKKITEEAMKVEDKTYATSWLDTEENYLHDRSQE